MLNSNFNFKFEKKISNIIKNIKTKDKIYKVLEYFDEKDIINQINNFSKQPNNSLENITFGIKDVYNTKFGHTKRGSVIYENYKSGNNARVVDEIILNKGLIIGKTKTAEFSIDEPPETINFFGNEYIAGTSSTGSAVGCRLGFFDIALGTQTAGSTFRPASYNGIFGFKPSFGVFPRTGLLKTTDTLDHVTLLGLSIKKIKKTFEVLRVKGKNYPLIDKNLQNRSFKSNNILFLKGYLWEKFDEYTRMKIEKFINTLKKEFNFHVNELTLKEKYSKIHQSHSKIYDKSLSYYFDYEYKNYKNKISNSTLQKIEKGKKVSKDEFQENIELQYDLIKDYSNNIKESIVISACTHGEAPFSNESEKNDMCLFYSYLHLPSISIPLFIGPNNLPISIIISSTKYNDYLLFDFIKKLQELKIVNDISTKDNN